MDQALSPEVDAITIAATLTIGQGQSLTLQFELFAAV